jgi:hypothetical protein
MKIWENKLEEAKASLELAKIKLELAEKELEESKEKTGIKTWLDYDFESSSGLTPKFSQFRKEIKKYIKNILDENLELIMPFGSLHFAFSGFIKNKLTGKYVYFSSSDVRFWKNAWYDNLLIRTAKDEKDFTGGRNDWCKLPDISKKNYY